MPVRFLIVKSDDWQDWQDWQNPGFASPKLKNLAIFSIFGDFLLRSHINSLMIFENHPIFVSTESVLRKFAQTLKKKGNELNNFPIFRDFLLRSQLI